MGIFHVDGLVSQFNWEPIQVSPMYVVVFLTVHWQSMLVATFLSRFLSARNDPSGQLYRQQPTTVFVENHFPQIQIIVRAER